MKKFSWGKVIDRFTYDFDGTAMNVIKYHPWKVDGCTILTGQPDETKIVFSCEELHESSENLYHLIIAFIAYKNLGLNQDALVAGIGRSLCLKFEDMP